MSAQLKIVQKEKVSESNKKWGGKAMSLGYLQFPSLLITRQRELGMNAVDMNIVLHIAACWWQAENLPYPSKRKIADAMGLDVSTIRRRIAALERAGILKRHKRWSKQQGQQSNHYDLSGLAKKLEPLAVSEAELRETQQTRKGRKKIALAIVKASE